MPELPDVEVFRRYLNVTALSKTISKTQVFETRLLEGVSAAKLARRLTGSQLEETRRHGKHLFARASGGGWLVLHFGMTGFLKYFKNDKDPPEHTRLLLHFDNAYSLAYVNQRKLGKIGWASEVSVYLEQNDLGPDALSDALGEDTFKERLRGNRGTLKSRLMNQSILAGLGNIYTDEILYQAGLHPETPLDALDDEMSSDLYRGMRSVLETAIEKQADPERLPRDSLLPHREDGAECPKCGGTIRKIKVGGRSTYYCETHQSKSR